MAGVLRTAGLIALILADLCWGSAIAGTITHLPGGMKCADYLNDGRQWCVFTLEIGTITPSTLQGIRKLIEYRSSFTKPVGGSAVILNSPGGDLNSAYQIGRAIHDQKYSARIPAGARCVSACVFILAAAGQRVIDGQVGIHRPFFTNTSVGNESADKIQNDYGSAVDRMRSYLREMNVDARLADQMLRIDPDRVRYLSRIELDSFGIGEGAPSSDVEKMAKLKETVEVKAASAYSLSRLEYMRRNELIEKICQLGPYKDPEEPPDFASYGLTADEAKLPPGEKLKVYLHREEDGWSRCYKHVMIYGR